MGEAISKHNGLWNRLLFSILIFLGVCLTGIFGFILLFHWKAIDAVYMVVITIFGVGYGEVEPVDEVSERIFVIMMIIVGNSAALYVVGELVRTLTQGEIVKAFGDMRESRRVEGIKHHTIICGYGRIGQILAAELALQKHPFIVVDSDKERIAQAHVAGFLTVEGSATEEATLLSAGIARADVLATVLPQDTLNVFITLTARNLNKDIRIIARGEQPMTEKKLRQAGANEVILPSSIGGLRIAHSITRPALMDYLGGHSKNRGQDFHHLGLEVHELSLEHHSKLEGWNVGEIQRKAEGNLMVLAIRRVNGEIVREGLEELSIAVGDSLIVMGRLGGVPEFLKPELGDRELI